MARFGSWSEAWSATACGYRSRSCHRLREKARSDSASFSTALHGLSPSDLAEVLWTVLCRGEIEFTDHAEGEDRLASARGAPGVLAWLLEEGEHRRLPPGEERSQSFHKWYRVTELGIGRWETYAIPNWNKYRGEFTGRLYDDGETTWSQSAATEPFAREVLEVYAAEAWQPAVLHWETVTIEHHVPWEPFHGKMLPSAVTVSVKVTERGQQQFTGDQYVALLPFLKEHDRRFRGICRWYENSTANHPDCPRRPERGIADKSF